MPPGREREAREQRGDAFAVVGTPPSTLEHEATVRERPGADPGAQPAIHGAGERRDLRRQARQLGGSARHGEGELGARAEARVRRDGVMDAKPDSQLDHVVRSEPAGEVEHPRRVRALGREARRRVGFDQQ